jgi:hypothetical protein
VTPEAQRKLLKKEYDAKRNRELKDVLRAKRQEWRKANPELARERSSKYSAKWRAAHPEKWRGYVKRWLSANKGYAAKWRRDNRHKCSPSEQERRTVEKRAAPAWRNKFFIEEIYDLARLRSKLTGIPHHVDHIVPLRSKLVCGLHVEHNMRVVPATENVAKSNKIWEGMP